MPAARMVNFIVGVTNSAPNIVAPVRGTYPICGTYPSTPSASERCLVNCSTSGIPPARYLIIQLPVTGNYANMAEVEVFTTQSEYFQS